MSKYTACPLETDARPMPRATDGFRSMGCIVTALLIASVLGPFASQAHAVQMLPTHDTWLSELSNALVTGNDPVNKLVLSFRRSTTGQQNHTYLTFDLSSLTRNVETASLMLTAQKANAAFTLHVFGAFEDSIGAWDETAINYSNASVLFPDSVSANSESTSGRTLMDQFDLVPAGEVDNVNAKVTELGMASIAAAAINAPFTFTSPELAGFLNAARSNGDTSVTFLLATSSLINMQYYSKEGTALDERKPILDAVLVAPPGDFDGDGDVDGADFVVWQTNFPKTSGALPIEGDTDADTDVDGADFALWQANFPASPGSGVSPIPEPSAICLLSLGSLVMLMRRRIRGTC